MNQPQWSGHGRAARNKVRSKINEMQGRLATLSVFCFLASHFPPRSSFHREDIWQPLPSGKLSFLPHWTLFRPLLHSSEVAHFHYGFCLLPLALDRELLERKSCVLFICTQPIKCAFKETWASWKKLSNRIWVGRIIKEGCLSFLSLRPWFSKCCLWTRSTSITGNPRNAHPQAWSQTYWTWKFILVRDLQSNRTSRIFVHI